MAFRHRIFNSLHVDLRRAIISKRFLLCVFCEILILLLIVGGHVREEGASVTYIFAWFPLESLYMAFFILPVIPYAHGYMTDQSHRFLIQSEMRIGKFAYALSKACATAISGALSMVNPHPPKALSAVLTCVLPKHITYSSSQWIGGIING